MKALKLNEQRASGERCYDWANPMVHLKTFRCHDVSERWWVALAILGPLVLCCIYLLRPYLHARYVLRDFEALELGHSTFVDAQRLATRIDAHCVSVPCNRSSCEWAVKIGNSDLPEWWRGHGETFLVSFQVKKSIVVRKNVGYGIGVEASTFYPSSVAVIEQEHWGRTGIPEPLAAGWSSSNLYRYYEFRVYMTPQASTQDQRRYTSFNLNCLWKYRGCADARELLPGAPPY